MSSGIGTRTWRAGVIVFLTVFLGGMGITGASALWSQQATASAGVATGHWKDTSQPGWSVPLDVTIASADYDVLRNTHTAVLTWTPRNASDRLVPGITYLVTVVNTDGDGSVHSVGSVVASGDRRSVSMVISRGWLAVADFRMTITPVHGGVSGRPEVRNVQSIAWDLKFI